MYLVLIVFGGAFFDSLGSRNQTGIKDKFKPGPYQFMFFTCFWVSIFSFTLGKSGSLTSRLADWGESKNGQVVLQLS